MTFYVKATIAGAALLSFFAAPAVYSLVNPGGPAYAIFQKAETRDVAADEAAPVSDWVAAAPGLIEPIGGLFKVGTAQLGRVSEVFVAPGDPVEQGQLLIKLEDGDARARLAAALIRAEVREKARDDLKLSSSRRRVREAQDEVYHAERARTGARFALDTLLASRKSGAVDEKMLSDARARLLKAVQRVETAKIALAEAESRSGLAAPSEAEAAVSEARSQVEIAEALLEKTRVRAPSAGRILHVEAKAGQLLAPQPGRAVVSLGDVSSLQVIAEVDEADVAKVRLAQTVTVKSLGYPDRDFKGQVVGIAPALGPARLGSRGPRRSSDVEVVEVTVELTGDELPLLPGMRADVYFEG